MQYPANKYNQPQIKENPFRPSPIEIQEAVLERQATVTKWASDSIKGRNVEVAETCKRIRRANLVPSFVFVRRALARTLIRGMCFKWYDEAEFLTWQDFPHGSAYYDEHSPLSEYWSRDEVKRRRAFRSAPCPTNYRFLERVVWLPRQGRFDVIDLAGKELLSLLQYLTSGLSAYENGAFLSRDTVRAIADRCERRELVFGEARLPKVKLPLAPDPDG